MSALKIIFAVFLEIASLAGCRSNVLVPQIELVERQEALNLSREAAISSGYDLSKYQLGTFGEELSKDKLQWLFHYLCSPFPPHPGCEFLVVVDRRTGKTEIYPGE